MWIYVNGSESRYLVVNRAIQKEGSTVRHEIHVLRKKLLV